MSESIVLFSAAMSLANLLYQAKRTREQSKTRAIESFESELKDFVNNVLGWYNQIIKFSYPLLGEIEHGRLSAETEKEYSKLLETIRRSDVYYSKCEHFVYKGLKR